MSWHPVFICVKSISSDLKTWKNMADRNGFCLFRKTLMHISNSRTLWRCTRNTTPSTCSSGQFCPQHLCPDCVQPYCHGNAILDLRMCCFRSDLVAVLHVMHLHRTLLQWKALSALDLFDTVCLQIDTSWDWVPGGGGNYTWGYAVDTSMFCAWRLAMMKSQFVCVCVCMLVQMFDCVLFFALWWALCSNFAVQWWCSLLKHLLRFSGVSWRWKINLCDKIGSKREQKHPLYTQLY